MFLLKLIGKIILIPIMLALTLIQWVGIFLNSISGVILGILAFIFALTGIASLAFGLASGSEALKMMVVAFLFFIIPVTGEWIVIKIVAAKAELQSFIKS
ncbi:hypothetical protein SAMN04487833_12714 [Sarcina sp. DSM 11001]|uniref:hypothetical protein n=1 Tax=Sarcina sp. DSM 11001 TaxID=1798184 RepID=UPI000888E29B|nr:hypothetical protein [Sarcina sp. DSM 11001]SDL68519.1 hypothetical protein SAMN04487833_12714 [Sarcina sp. DSM 11001]